ncbi:uncharacterized protein LOC121645496 [Melanotaenia boesemani]|uniref:uncharacterized protein LOC121645496 n=1 Tax=Melanotaenia boesemani TaxID=1250792 RepID=UPI001C0505D1|nr:uncharacterized protein LOC121645496 [Melanotaenia boesemani]
MSRRSGRTCAVIGCSNSSGKLQKWNKTECKEHRPLLYENCPCLRPFSLHRFPGRAEHKDVLQKWVENINRKDFIPNINSTVCGVHFPEGKPTKENPYPVLHMGYDHYGAMSGQGPPKRRCLKSLAINTSCVESEKSAIEDNVSHFDIEPLLESDVDVQWSEDQAIAAEHNYCSKLTTDCATQTDPAPSLSAHDLNEEDSKFFTGIGVHCFWQLLYALVALVPQPMIMTLAVHDQLLLVLMRLRLGLMFRDLSKRFGISRRTASEIFSLWRPILAQFMRENVIAWLPRNTLKRIRPQHFSEHYPHVTCIVECTELCVQKPKYLKNVPQIHSNSKQLNTYKVLYCMAPNGYVMFVSKLFGVEASDGFITKNSGFADHLIPGDQILAGHGFSNTDELPPGVTLATFTQDCKELFEHEVTETRRFANFKIHFERALNRLKGFKILSNVIPHTVKHVDDIVSICAGLCNLQP